MASLENVIVYHAPNTRSTRIIWLLQELGLPFKLEPTQRGAPELKQIHPLGKIPLILVNYTNGVTDVVTESGHILSYILRHFDTNKKLTGQIPEDVEAVDFFLHYAEGSFMPLVVPQMMAKMMGGVKSPLDEYNVNNTAQAMEYLEDILAKQHQLGSKFLVGNTLTAADIVILFPVQLVCMLGLVPVPANVGQWMNEIMNLESYKEAAKNDKQ